MISYFFISSQCGCAPGPRSGLVPPSRTTSLSSAERPAGTFSRQLILGDTLDTDAVTANYDAGVLTLRIPIREQAKPRKIEITGSHDQPAPIEA